MPRSRVDYATDQITVYRYCPYACKYCYVWRNRLFVSRVQRGKYDPVEEAEKYLNKKNRVIVVSFVSDPYPPEEQDKKLTRKVLEILCRSKNRIMILTKNPRLALRDIDIMKQGDCWLGTTVITTDPRFRVLEPNVESGVNRLLALAKAKKEGVRVWLSIEPIIPHVTDLDIILSIASKIPVDYVVLGRYNYWKRIALPVINYMFSTEFMQKIVSIDPNPVSEEELVQWYKEHIPKAIDFLKQHGINYHIKKELAKVIK